MQPQSAASLWEEMRSFGVKAVGFCALYAVFVFGTDSLYARTPANRAHIVEYKDQRIRGSKHPRLVVAGGSSARYGVNSQVLQETFSDHTVTNAAISVHEGLLFYFHWLTPLLDDGDVLLLQLEHRMLTRKSGLYGNEALSKMTYSYADMNGFLTSSPRMLHWYALQTPARLKAQVRERRAHKTHLGHDLEATTPTPDHDVFGDMSAPERKRPLRVMQEQLALPHDENLQALRAGVEALQAKGVVVVAAYQPMAEGTYSRAKKATDEAMVQALQTGVPTLPVVNTPSQGVFAEEAFANTTFHLDRGPTRDAHTRILAEGVAKALQAQAQQKRPSSAK